jgi:hypothetical protein
VRSDDNCPVPIGLPFVLAITASIFCSIKQLKAAAAHDTKPMPRIELSNTLNGTIPGADKNIPITAVKTIRELTRNLQRTKKFFKSI